MIKFVIEDEKHAEPQGTYSSFDEALAELKIRSTLPWDKEPNQCPCINWETCGRDYQILEYDCSTKPYNTLVNTTSVLSVSSKGAIWENEFNCQQ